MLGTFIKNSDDTLDYDLSFKKWIDAGDTIQTASATVEGSELAVDSVSVSSPSVKVWLSGGVDGKTYTVEVTATTAGGRVKEECFKIRIRNC